LHSASQAPAEFYSAAMAIPFKLFQNGSSSFFTSISLLLAKDSTDMGRGRRTSTLRARERVARV